MALANSKVPPAWLTRIGPALLLVPLLGVGGWWLAHSVPAPVAPPRWTDADLPALPAADANGWTVVTRPLPPELALDIPEPLAEWIAGAPRDTDAEHEQVRAFVATPAAREALARVEAAAQRPVFADACAPLTDCELLTWHEIHDAALVHVYARSLADDHAGAVELLASLLRLDNAQLASARSILRLLIAVDHLDDALAKAQWLLAPEAGLPDDVDTAAVLGALLDAVAQVDRERIDLRPLVVADYLVLSELIAEQLERQRWPLHRGQTTAELDARFVARHAAASAGELAGALGVDEPELTATPGWWLRNPSGKLILDALRFDAADLVADLERDLETITARRTELLEPR